MHLFGTLGRCDKNGSDWLFQTGSGFAKSAGNSTVVSVISSGFLL
jgi:hypothetical protein